MFDDSLKSKDELSSQDLVADPSLPELSITA
jgi:hypothetical protein